MVNMIIWGFLIKTIIYISVFGIITQIIDNIIERRKTEWQEEENRGGFRNIRNRN